MTAEKKKQFKGYATVAAIALGVSAVFAAFNMDSKVKAFKAKHSKKK